MSNSCASIKRDLVQCIYASPCFDKGGKFGDCLKETDVNELPEPCQQLRSTFTACKRGQLDMRNRMRGNLWEPHNPEAAKKAQEQQNSA